MFRITDATLNNGIYHPPKYDSVFIFVTEKKTPDRTQYVDKLTDNELITDGQTAGRTDYFIMDKTVGFELLLFYRQTKSQYPDFAFRYEGAFQYVSHTGKNPTRFHLKRTTKQIEPMPLPDDTITIQRHGQGFKISAEARKAIENYAMAKAEHHFQRLA